MGLKEKGDEGKLAEAIGKAELPKMVMVMKVNSDEEAVAVTEPWLKAKKIESLIPGKRRLVKRMMFDCILHFTASLFGVVHGSPTSSGDPFSDNAGYCLTMLKPPNCKVEMNGNTIFPHHFQVSAP